MDLRRLPAAIVVGLGLGCGGDDATDSGGSATEATAGATMGATMTGSNVTEPTDTGTGMATADDEADDVDVSPCLFDLGPATDPTFDPSDGDSTGDTDTSGTDSTSSGDSGSSSDTGMATATREHIIDRLSARRGLPDDVLARLSRRDRAT